MPPKSFNLPALIKSVNLTMSPLFSSYQSGFSIYSRFVNVPNIKADCTVTPAQVDTNLAVTFIDGSTVDLVTEHITASVVLDRLELRARQVQWGLSLQKVKENYVIE
eukprot:CAMPEP_0170748588 /NCGR_PEP_ID=MMETSP0437-20130122/9944_1 /TAXON_ID=0 /ORGANISM="Sexangularia sp." /LENGTH=106 /DNA_ID=CAMNT_0011087459 /DNA_START=44 /DNA_END=364 /DNA_ORIENTATION=-